jgi:two-component system, NtrC family, response regulator GlrR
VDTVSKAEPLHTRQIRLGDRVVGLQRRRLRLEVAKGPDRGRRCETEADRVVIGTHERCALALSDPTVSRQHCEIALGEGGYVVRDLGSTNGTFLDRARLGEVTVTGKTRLRVGESVIAMTPLDDAVEIRLPGDTQFGPLRGRSAAIRRIFDVLAKAAPTSATVLITGESGTGKELAARAIHEASDRARGPFAVVDCGALASTLIESELFGHERGAFTGAVKARAGAFEAASGGTIFLDEIGELPLDLQTRLLGALERREIQRLGSSDRRPIDVRVVAATNRDLRREINAGSFREDLYFRLAVVTVHMPPLRDRPEDVALYVSDFVADNPGLVLEAETVDRLCRQPWPGNVRELRNVLERAAALGEAPEGGVEAGELPGVQGKVDPSIPFKVGKASLVEQYERQYVTELMQAHGGNITQAARAAEIDRVYLLRLLDRYGLRPSRQARR